MRILILTLLFSLLSYGAKRTVEMTWTPTPGATAYEFKVYKMIKGDEKDFSTEKIQSTVWSKSLSPGDYSFQIRALDYRGVPGNWSEKKYFKVSLPTVNQMSPLINQGFDLIEDSDISVTFVWEEIPEADRYNFKLMDENEKVLIDTTTSDSVYSTDFERPGKYYWKVTALTSKDSTPSKVEYKKFFVVNPPKMPAPEVQFEVKDKYFSVFWSSSNLSEKDKISIYHKRDGKWERIFKEEKKKIRRINLIKNKIPKGEYKLKLISFTKNGQPSEPSNILFHWDQKEVSDVKNQSFMGTLTQGNMLASRFGKTPWSVGFGMSSTSLEYQSVISKTDSHVSSSFGGNNYHFYLGRDFKDSPWKWETDGWISSLVDSSNSWLLINASSAALYKMGNMIHEASVGAGLAYRSLPFFDANFEKETLEQASVNYLAVETQASYYYHFNDAISAGAEGKILINSVGLSHPQGAGLDTSTSFNYELGVRYLITRDIYTHFGLGFVNENLIYDGDEQKYTGQEFGIKLRIHF